MPNQTTRRKQQTRRPKEPPEPLLIVIPREDPLTRLILRDEKERALWDKQFGPQPTEERGRERTETDSDRDDNKRQEIADSSSISSEDMTLEPSEALEPSNMLADIATIQPTVASQTTDNSSPFSSSAASPQQLAILEQLTNVDASIVQLQAFKAFLVAQLPSCLQVETVSPPPSAPMQPVPAVHMHAVAMQAVPLVQQLEPAQPQPSADTGHAASSAPPPPVQQPPSSTRPPKQPRWTSCPSRGRTSYAAVAAGVAAGAAAAAAAAFTSQPSWRAGAPHGRHKAAAPSSFVSTFHVRRNFVFKAPSGSLPDSATSLKDRLTSFLEARLPGAPLLISDAMLLGSQAASTRVFFSLDSLEAADALVGRRGALKGSGVSIQDFLTPEEIETKRALWPHFLEAKARGQRPQFHRARLVVS